MPYHLKEHILKNYSISATFFKPSYFESSKRERERERKRERGEGERERRREKETVRGGKVRRGRERDR